MRKPYKQGSKFWCSVVSAVLCIILLSTSAVGALAAEVSMTETESQSAAGMEDVPSAEESTPPDEEGDDQSGNEENPDIQIVAWTWVDEEEILTEYNGEWYLSLPGAAAEDLTEDLIKEMLPKKVQAILSNDEEITFPLTWDLSSFPDRPAEAGEDNGDADAEVMYRFDASADGDYLLAENVEPPYVLFTLGGAEVYANYPGNRTTFSSSDELTTALAAHQVQGITPAGTTVNLFDYVASKDGAVESDLTTKEQLSDSTHRVAKSGEWNKGINANRLLLFGDSIVGAGYWNNGAGAGRKWAQDNTNMKGIVLPRLNSEGYPEINIKAANIPIANAGNYSEAQLPFCIAWAKDEDTKAQGEEYRNAPALSEKVLNNCTDSSLNYLFDPDVSEGDNKRSWRRRQNFVYQSGWFAFQFHRSVSFRRHTLLYFERNPNGWRLSGFAEGHNSQVQP